MVELIKMFFDTDFQLMFFALIYRQITIQIMSVQQLQESYFHNEEQLLNSPHGRQITACPGPTLQAFNLSSRAQLSASLLTCTEFMQKIEGIPDKETKFAGQGKQALLNSMSFILLVVASKQIKYYPHLLTLIKEHFFKPGVFADYEPGKRNRVLAICRNIEIQLISSCSVAAFFQGNQQFLHAFNHILSKVIGNEPQAYGEMVETIRRKFNIDCGRMEVPNSGAECWILGMQKKVYLIEELSYFFVITSSTSTEPTRAMNESTFENRIESQRSVQDYAQQIIIQASEQSTPKFKDNQESIRYRKKSHKNSFGGDFQITGYKQLANLLNKSQAQGHSRNDPSKTKKVFSLKFQMQEMGNLEGLNIDHIQPEQNRDGVNIAKNQLQMRGSNIEGNQNRLKSDKREQFEKSSRKKHITSSQIFELTNTLGKGDKKRTETKAQIIQNLKKSGQNMQENHENLEKKEEGEHHHQNLLNPNSLNTNPKQSFKFSFSKKDQKKFVFKEIESEGEGYDTQSVDGRKNEPSRNQFASTLPAHFKHLPSTNLLYQGQYFRKKQNRRSLMIENVVPIQEEVQSSQQEKTEEHSIPQSNVERERQLQNLERQQGQNFDRGSQTQSQSQQSQSQSNENGNQGFNWNSGNVEMVNPNGNKSYINIFKSKNRKFSYLTQPISMSKNSLFGGHNQLRQSFVDERNEAIPEEPDSKANIIQHNHQAAYIQNHHRHQQGKNRYQKTPKIHKNSEAVTESKPNKRRFEQNPISFSQMIANVNGHQDSNFSGHSMKNPNRRQLKASICSNTVEYTKSDIMCYAEPEGWTRKEVIYYFNDGPHEPFANRPGWDQRIRKPERYIIDRAFNYQKAPSSTSINHGSNQIKSGLQGDIVCHQGQNKEKGSSMSGAQTISNSHNTERPQGTKMYQGLSQAAQRFINTPSNNIRSTIDTAKNTQAKASNNGNSQKNTNIKKITQTPPPTIHQENTRVNPQLTPNEHVHSHYEVPFYDEKSTKLSPTVASKSIKNNFQDIFKQVSITPSAPHIERTLPEKNTTSAFKFEPVQPYFGQFPTASTIPTRPSITNLLPKDHQFYYPQGHLANVPRAMNNIEPVFRERSLTPKSFTTYGTSHTQNYISYSPQHNQTISYHSPHHQGGYRAATEGSIGLNNNTIFNTNYQPFPSFGNPLSPNKNINVNRPPVGNVRLPYFSYIPGPKNEQKAQIG